MNPLERPTGPDIDWLVLDLNSFFASCEQQDNPALRGRPVGVVPMMGVDTTCVLAASIEAKRFGIKTGTPVDDAKMMCPGIVLLPASHKKYVTYHHKILAAIETCAPIERVLSIDEVACRMTGSWRKPENAVALAHKMKAAITRDVGPCLRSSIGIAPNTLLAKFASDMQKPDGLVVIRPCDLPDMLFRFELRDFCGIGPAMEKRLKTNGIYTMRDLYDTPRDALKRVWGGVEGLRFHAKIWGHNVERDKTERRVIGHQHVLEPHLRSIRGAHDVLAHLTVKAAERLRHMDYFCTRLGLDIKLDGQSGYWGDDTNFTQTQDTQFLLEIMEKLWRGYDGWKPLRVGVTLSGLVPASAHQGDLFQKQKPKKLYDAVDSLNGKFGRHTITFGLNPYIQGKVGLDKIAFQRVPEILYL
jgi:DNA polymerase-4